MSSRHEHYENAMQALCAYYNREKFYDNYVHPLTTRKAAYWIGGAVVVVVVANGVYALVREAAIKKECNARIETARARRDRELDAIKGQLGNVSLPKAEEDTILWAISQGPYTVFCMVRERKFKLASVLRVYQRRCLHAQDVANPVTHIFADAIDYATRLDTQVGQSGDDMPPLYGLIFSATEMFCVKDTDACVGLTKYLGNLAHSDAVIIKAMREQGAVLIAKTNVPQTLLSFGSSNPVYGKTTSPHDSERSPGGSSSGEGALLALNGSMLGWGSDISGALRVPAHYCGVAALRPMNGRFSHKGILDITKVNKVVEETYGTMSRDVNLIATVHKALLSNTNTALFQQDAEVPPMLWRDELYESESKLRIGYFTDDGLFPVTPGVKRAVTNTVKELTDQGHTLIPFEVPDAWYAHALYNTIAFGDRLTNVKKHLENEIVDPVARPLYEMSKKLLKANFIQQWLLVKTSALMSKRVEYVTKSMIQLQKPEDLFTAFAKRDEYRAKFLDQCNQLGLDLLVCPVSATPAVKSGTEPVLVNTCSYTQRFNLLDLPAGVVPVTLEDVDDQRALDGYPETDNELKLVKETTRGALGLPIGVQIVGMPYGEEIVLRVMRDLQATIGHDFVGRLPGLWSGN